MKTTLNREFCKLLRKSAISQDLFKEKSILQIYILQLQTTTNDKLNTLKDVYPINTWYQ